MAGKTSYWKCGKFNIALDRPRIMGVVNVTPDSFSDGGDYDTTQKAVEHALNLLDQGADIIDVGGESTRPGFTPVTPEVEAKRVVPVVRALVERDVIVSIDTRHPEVAELCVNLGASIINDVEGFSNPAMVDVAAKSNAGCIVMHAGSCSENNRHHTHVQLDSHRSCEDELNELMADIHYNSHFRSDNDHILRIVKGFLNDKARILEKAGVSKDRICIDPGTGFGKNAEEDIVLQRSFKRLATLGYPVMCAISRKRMTGALIGSSSPDNRDAVTAGMCVGAVEQGANILRVHNVSLCRDVLDGYWATIHPVRKRAFIALGSNVGNRIGYLQKALAQINEIPLTKIKAVSHAYDTEPAYGLTTSVVDAVAEIETELNPLALLRHLQKIEENLGRKRIANQPHSAPRTIDLDLLWMDDEVHAGEFLQLPHPRMGERDFVLRPMEDVLKHPERMLSEAGVNVVAPDKRIGKVTEDLGELEF